LIRIHGGGRGGDGGGGSSSGGGGGSGGEVLNRSKNTKRIVVHDPQHAIKNRNRCVRIFIAQQGN